MIKLIKVLVGVTCAYLSVAFLHGAFAVEEEFGDIVLCLVLGLVFLVPTYFCIIFPFTKKYKEKEAKEICQKFGETKIHLGGLGGHIELNENTVIISKGVASGQLRGSKTIPLIDITSIKYKPSAKLVVSGYIKFFYAGNTQVDISPVIGERIYEDDSMVAFPSSKNKDFMRLKQEIEKRMLIFKSGSQTTQVVQQLSVADEIEKLVQLMDKGILTKNEFEKEKQELLAKM